VAEVIGVLVFESNSALTLEPTIFFALGSISRGQFYSVCAASNATSAKVRKSAVSLPI